MTEKAKKKPKTVEKVSPKEIAGRIGETAKSMVTQINKLEDPEFTTKQRGKSNVIWDEKKGYLELGANEITRTFLNIAHARKFMQTSMIMQKAQEYLLHNKTASIREIYYELKHTVADTKENTFEGQDESDPIIVDLEHSVDTIREKLNLHANPKGTLYGNITLLDRMHHNDKFNAAKLGRGGWSIMSRVEPEEIEIVESDAEYLLVAETEAIFERLIEEGYPKDNRCLLIGTGGQAARGARRLIHRVHNELDLPTIVFSVDGEETVVIEENGLIRNVMLKDLMKGKELVKIDGIIENERGSINAKTPSFDDTKTSFGQIDQVIRHPIVEEMYEVKTDVGYNVKLTRSHSLIVYDSKKNAFVEKTPLEVDKENDFAIISLDVPNNESVTEIDLAAFIYNYKQAIVGEDTITSARSNSYIPRFIKNNQLADFCRLLGYYAAEGHADGDSVTFSFNKSESQYIADVKSLAFGLFGKEAKEYFPHSTLSQTRINCRLLANIFKELASTGAKDKKVPDIVFNVPARAKKEFLKGYFLGDGRVDFKKEKSSVELWAKTISKKLAYDLVLLISQIGANATIQRPKENYEEHYVEMETASGAHKTKIVAKHAPYLVSVANKEALLCMKEIVAELNLQALEHIQNEYIKTPKLDSLPREFVAHYREDIRKECRGRIEEILPPAVFQWPRISKEKIRKLFEGKTISKNLELLKNLAESKTTLARIKEVEKTKPSDNYVYDIEMKGTHRFFSNFICVHNTDGDPYGWYIYSVIKQGSMALAAHSEFMSVPDAKYVGMTIDDVKEYKLEAVTEHMTEGDIKRAKEMLAYPWFQNKEWQDQLKKALDQKIRIEQQALANKRLDFVATHYLPEKIKNKTFLP